MPRRSTAALFSVVVLAACVAQPGPSGAPGPTLPGETPSGETASHSAIPSPPTSVDATPPAGSATPEPFPTLEAFPSAIPVAGVPAALEQVAWAGARTENRPDGSSVHHVFGGLLNHPPTVRLDVDDPAGYPWLATAAGAIGIATSRGDGVHLEIRNASDARIIGATDARGGGTGKLAIDPPRKLAYLATTLAGGGLAIHRLTFDGTADDVLIRLDKRFTPDGIPSERWDLTIDPDGVLVVEACARADGCLLWEVPPGMASAPKARTLSGHPPIVCSIVGATRDWLVVQDDAACTADTGDAPLPVRAIRRSDGTSHLVTDDHVDVGRVVESDGRTVLAAADPILAGATVNIDLYEIGSGTKTVVVRGLAPSPSEQAIRVSRAVLPGTWILLEPWFVESTALPEIPARLLDLSTGQVIELPFGSFGWT